ncbi:unnamed protein product [Mytilus coruscus]|uniref:RNase H type-1 domain-containing protein n=1 Tax=Mytilus coruscus TaxID=42192 RepID=A0A6J8CTN2_MYTCO|nr:unnamed protein product [Mytilus coruscus]
MPSNSKSSMGNSKTIGKNNRQTSFNNASYNSSKSTMQIPAVITNKIVGRRQILRNKNTTFKRGPRRIGMVDKPDRSIKRSGYHIGHPRHGYNHRCIKQRLGADCGNISTGGQWGFHELEYHINLKELLAALLGLKVFTKSAKCLAVHMRVDNTTAVAYINKIGDTKSGTLIQMVKEIWMWCKEREITLTAKHLPGISNHLADWESRNMSDTSDWMVDRDIFSQVIKS